MQLIIEPKPAPTIGQQAFELVERKGLGHPDTLCDALAEAFSAGLCRFYRDAFGMVLHHNVDKALLVGGRSSSAFGGGNVMEPIDLHLAGRATLAFDGVTVPVQEIAEETCRGWFRRHMHAFDAELHLRIHCHVRPGSRELAELFARQMAAGRPLANDTSCGVGFAPLTRLEAAVLDIERRLNSPDLKARHPEIGEDIKVMGLRQDDRVDVTLGCAFVDRYVADIDDYREKKSLVAGITARTAASGGDEPIHVSVNAADDIDAGDIYLTVTGTSAESGDDGEVGRGNRANGLITPFRPMTLEAAAGKNPISHVGKLYNIAAQRIADRAVAEIEVLDSVDCLLVSRIGAPVAEPQAAYLSVTTTSGIPSATLDEPMRAIVDGELQGLAGLWEEIVDGDVQFF